MVLFLSLCWESHKGQWLLDNYTYYTRLTMTIHTGDFFSFCDSGLLSANTHDILQFIDLPDWAFRRFFFDSDLRLVHFYSHFDFVTVGKLEISSKFTEKPCMHAFWEWGPCPEPPCPEKSQKTKEPRTTAKKSSDPSEMRQNRIVKTGNSMKKNDWDPQFQQFKNLALFSPLLDIFTLKLNDVAGDTSPT